MQMQSTIDIDPVIYLAIELGASTWLVAGKLPTSEKTGLHRLEAGNSRALLALIACGRKWRQNWAWKRRFVSCVRAINTAALRAVPDFKVQIRSGSAVRFNGKPWPKAIRT